MGLDLAVYCDCVEQGHLLVPHPFPQKLYIEANGCPEIRSEALSESIAHDQWMELPPCRHASMRVFESRLGNIGEVSYLRSIVCALAGEQSAQLFPILLGKVLYSGSHSGDFLTPAEANQLAGELVQLLARKPAGIAEADWSAIETMGNSLAEACKLAGSILKPVAF